MTDIWWELNYNQPRIDEKLGESSNYPLMDMKLVDREGKVKTSVQRPILPEDSNDGDEDGPGPRYFTGNTNDPIQRYENYQDKRDHTKLYEYYKHRFLIGRLRQKSMVIRLTDENYSQINVELEELFNSSDGLSCNSEYGLFFFIDSKQPILNQDLQTLKDNKTDWEVKTYSFETFSYDSLNKSTQSSHQVTSKIEEVLPIGEFDKIWSYSYYSEKLEENA